MPITASSHGAHMRTRVLVTAILLLSAVMMLNVRGGVAATHKREPLRRSVTSTGGTARLGSDPTIAVPNIDYFPLGGAPLYLILEGVDDIQALGVDLRWSPDDLTGPCFWIAPDTTESASCGSVDCVPPIGGLGSDSTC